MSENERMKEELTIKIQVKFQHLKKSFNKLKKDTENVRKTVEGDLGRIEDRVTAHTKETRKQIDISPRVEC
jgi:hypothetical protein